MSVLSNNRFKLSGTDGSTLIYPLRFDQCLLRGIQISSVFNDFCHETILEKLRRYGSREMIEVWNQTHERNGLLAPFNPVTISPFDLRVSKIRYSFDLGTLAQVTGKKLCALIPEYGVNIVELIASDFSSFFNIVDFILGKYPSFLSGLRCDRPPVDITANADRIRAFRGAYYTNLTHVLKGAVGEPFPSGYSEVYNSHPRFRDVDFMLSLTNVWILYTIAMALESHAETNLAVAKVFGIPALGHAPGYRGIKRKVEELKGNEWHEPNRRKLVRYRDLAKDENKTKDYENWPDLKFTGITSREEVIKSTCKYFAH